MALNSRHQLCVGQVEVRWHPHRLVDVPRRIDEELQPVALGVARINRNRVAMRDGIDLFQTFRDEARVKLPERVEAVRFE
ncbi:hypothetical protein QF000_002397 [Paraburkholderia atlantica]|uniref:Uncharacterized protein n=1 Tax=Paraburkholderia atlantica TaxID=2654982 RepID=A0A7W8Q983_PARAM|nr:hypothetical protein [Paraburkholderia atlantica]MBB5426065.1 hypothetical protein [Paraburkholderia atlantica]